MKYIITAEIFVKLINFLLLPFFVINMTPDEFSNFNITFAQVAFFSFLIGGGAFNVYASEISNAANPRAESTIIKFLLWWGICSIVVLYILVLILQINDLGNIFYNTPNYNIYNYMTVLAAGLTSLTLMLYVRTQLNHDWRRLLIFIVLKNALATVLAVILINFSNESQDLVVIRLGTIILIELLIIVLYFDVLKKLMMVNIFDFRLASIDNNIVVRLLKNLPIAVLSGAIPFGERMALSSIVNSVDFRDYVIAIQLLSPLSLFIGAANQVKIRFLMSKDTNNNDLFAYIKLIAILSVGYVGLLFFAAYPFSLFIDEIKNLPQMLLLISPLVTMQIICQILVTRCIGIGQEISVLVFNLSLCCYLVFSGIVIQNLVVFLLFFFAVYILFSLKFVRVLR